MRPEKLQAMANQIATFFRSYPDDQAVAGIHRHLHAFWTPVMVATLRDHLGHTPSGADVLVQRALLPDSAADGLCAASPAERVVSPAHAGAMATDAG